MTPSDESLLSRYVAEGCLAAFHELHDRYRERIFHLTWRYCGDFQRAEEITQDTFLKVSRHAPEFRFEGKVSSWIYRIARNESKIAAKKAFRRRLVFLEDLALGEEPKDIPASAGRADRLLEKKEKHAIVRSCLNSLPFKYRRAILLSNIEQRSHREVAEIAGCRPGTIGSLVSRGRRILYQRLKDELER